MTTIYIIIAVIAAIFIYRGYKYIQSVDSDYQRIPITVVVEKTNTGYSCYCREIDGYVSVGGSVYETKNTFEEAFQHYLDSQEYISGPHSGLYRSDFEFIYVEE